jgi:hypothetical protein
VLPNKQKDRDIPEHREGSVCKQRLARDRQGERRKVLLGVQNMKPQNLTCWQLRKWQKQGHKVTHNSWLSPLKHGHKNFLTLGARAWLKW